MQGRAPLLAVCGTRPEAVKLAPLIGELRQRGQRVLLLASGQHRDLAPRMFEELGLVPDIELGEAATAAEADKATGTVAGPEQSLATLVAAITPVLRAARPALVLVQGDTVSTLAGALAASYAKLPLAHVEAGLRTGDPLQPHPEEMHRRLIAPLANLHFAPTRRAGASLRAEGIDRERIFITGNTGIDCLLATCARLDSNPALQQRLRQRFAFLDNSGFLLATVHRRENGGARLDPILAALARLAASSGSPLLVPLHPNPMVQIPFREKLGGRPGVHLLEPLDHAGMVWLLRRARLLLTDSGGLQEEAPSLGLRTLVLRQATERPEAIDAGAAELAPADSRGIVAAARRLMSLPPLPPLFPFGDGHAAPRIAGHILDWLGYQAVPAGRLRAFG